MRVMWMMLSGWQATSWQRQRSSIVRAAAAIGLSVEKMAQIMLHSSGC